MRVLSRATTAILAMLTFSAVGCERINKVRANGSFKEANAAYAAQDYKKAAEGYEFVVQSNPNLDYAYFYLGNCYDNQYKPSKKGDPANDQLLDKAAKYYQTAADKMVGSADPQNKKLGLLALAYLVTLYGPDKANDPGKAEEIVQRLIRLDPAEPTYYFQLAKIYEDSGVYDEAERVYAMAKSAKPNDPTVYTTLAGFYNRQGEFGKLIDALEERATKEPNNPEAYHTLASYYWDEATRDSRLNDKEKMEYVQKGIKNVDQAIKIKPDYVEALIYKGLLLRLQANLEKDSGKQQALIKEATQLHDQAEEIRKRKAAGLD
jgi:tetratricopeptide (TPR) repeat protein